MDHNITLIPAVNVFVGYHRSETVDSPHYSHSNFLSRGVSVEILRQSPVESVSARFNPIAITHKTSLVFIAYNDGHNKPAVSLSFIQFTQITLNGPYQKAVIKFASVFTNCVILSQNQ